MGLVSFKNFSPSISPCAVIFDGCHIIGDVHIGKNCSIWFGSVLRGDNNAIRVGDRSNIQDNTVIHTEPSTLDSNDFGSVQIGSDVTIGHNCIIHACKIENLCLIGMGSIIMDGAHISEFSIVGAGSLITKGKIFPPKSLIMGNPAKLVRTLSEDEIKSIKDSASDYVDLAKAYSK
ncbi:gamma carbonic anhydrase family protein [Helicobacter sp. 13S00482-2]|uniref:gamma carbonic anhydrase family protein n=1 Tax=Helicobacter sp. 13S00482-2 TaxID=1476200 RepID=UPI000BA5EC58|nr:gamma carbonic anhydrase family protein [Helicobacter sp. 13S00482-2]PAF53928.1 gamma carbonic anhydrase family protein [Helicobacter sp. 13S00482-2]